MRPLCVDYFFNRSGRFVRAGDLLFVLSKARPMTPGPESKRRAAGPEGEGTEDGK